MKYFSNKHLAVLTIAFLLLTSLPVFADDPPPPPPQGHGQNGNQPPGGGAPIGEGLAILLALGATYGYKKFKQSKKED